MTTDRFEQLPSDLLSPNPYNRKRLGDLVEMTDSIRVHGVIEPLIVREIGRSAFEIVAGERRWRAAQLAELAAVPCLVRELTDEQVIEIVIVENCQREDLHPVDEARSYSILVERGHAIAEIAGKVGRSPAHVAQRLRLLDAAPEVLEALEQGRILLGVALALVKLPPDVQREALDDVSQYDDSLITVGEARRLIEEHHMLRLANAPWALDDGELVKNAGACSTCPKRTGVQAELFADASSPDLCTDRTCFKAKSDAAWKVRSKEAKKQGLEVVDEKSVANANQYGRGAFVRLDEERYTGSGKHKPLKTILGKQCPPVAAIGRAESGAIVELVKRADADRILKARERAKAEKSGAESARDRQRDEKEKAAAEREATDRAIAKVLAEVEQLPESAAVFDLLMLGVLQGAHYEELQRVIKRRQIDTGGERWGDGDLADWLREKPLSEKASIAIELALLGRGIDEEGWKDRRDTMGLGEWFPRIWLAVEKLYKVDWGKELAAAKKARTAAAAAKAKDKGKPAKAAKASPSSSAPPKRSKKKSTPAEAGA